MPNIKSTINTHGKKLLNKQVKQNTRKCNCISKYTCSLKGNYLLENNLYISTIKSEKKNYQPRNYKGISENTFKKQCANQNRSFNIKSYKTMRNYPSEVKSRKLQPKGTVDSEKSV